MCHYKHLSVEDREKIRVFHEQGLSIAETARRLGRNKSTISRELKRNSNTKNEYSAHKAQKKYKKRKKACGAKRKLENRDARQYVEEKLQNFWSPEQIIGRAKLEKQSFSLSCNTIYRAIDNGLLPKTLKKNLRIKKKNKRCKKDVDNRGKIPNTVNISQRSKSIENRFNFGHWESDTIRGQRQTGCIGTHVERKSGYLIAFSLSDRQNGAFNKATVDAFKYVSVKLKKSFTVDNGKEFSQHEFLSFETGMSVYFCDPNSPWQRGTNENTNGLLRQFFPKKTSFRDVSEERLAHAVGLLNNRPRKRLKFRTPCEILRKASLLT